MHWIRGVNLGGWLLIERYIVPYQYALTDCHVRGDLCWYNGSLSAPPASDPEYQLCNLEQCQPFIQDTIQGPDYPIDEWHLVTAFDHHSDAKRWLNHHFRNFLTKQDLVDLIESGVTHVRVPLPHWILGDIVEGEPWIAGDRYHYFRRLCDWARELGLQVWPNLHTAPGSQNGFDNSGIENTVYTCGGWGDSNANVARTLDILHHLTQRLADDQLLDVVTGFGLLNEPFADCNDHVYRMFLTDAFRIARDNLGPDVALFVSDKFGAPSFNDGRWWLDADHANTYLDTHFYQVFSASDRSMTTLEHLDLVCHPQDGEKLMESCCWKDPPNNTVPSNGVRRISTEWSAAFDAMPGELLAVVMQGIRDHGVAPDFDRVLSPARQDFLRNFVEAQMVAYEAADSGQADGWFFWTFKTEGGAFAEWDFLRGVADGWMPRLAPSAMASQDLYGHCESIMARTDNRTDLVHPFPWGDEPYWRPNETTSKDETAAETTGTPEENHWHNGHGMPQVWLLFALVLILVSLAVKCLCRTKRVDYERIGETK